MRLVLDTNVLIAAFVARGRCADIVAHCAEVHDLVTSDDLLSEFREKLTGKFRQTLRVAEERIALLRSGMEVVVPAPLPAPVCRDPDDDIVLGTAMAGGCSHIVTGDRDLLVLVQYQDIRIISPTDFPL